MNNFLVKIEKWNSDKKRFDFVAEFSTSLENAQEISHALAGNSESPFAVTLSKITNFSVVFEGTINS